MPGQKLQITPLEARRQMLLIESELNRIEFSREWDGLQQEIHRVTDPLRAFSFVARSAAKAGKVFSALHRILSPQKDGQEKKSWFSSLFDGANAGASLWTTLRSIWK